MKRINTTKAPAAIGPYNQAIKVNGFVYTSGQIPINPETRELIEDHVENATKQAMENLKSVLTEANSSFDNVVKSTIFLKNMDDFSIVNEVYASYFNEGKYPARETVQVAKLPKDALVEIAMIAIEND